jgi:hypothetical protein
VTQKALGAFDPPGLTALLGLRPVMLAVPGRDRPRLTGKRHWHLLMLAYGLLKPGTATSAPGTILARATSLRNDVKRSFRESIHNLLSWALNSPDRSVDELIHQSRACSSNV